MRVRKEGPNTGSVGAPTLVDIAPQRLVETDTTIDVGVVIVAIPTGSSDGTNMTLTIQNVSTAGQKIRFGMAPSFGATLAGLLLNPGDTYTFENFGGFFFGGASVVPGLIADAAGGKVSVLLTSNVI